MKMHNIADLQSANKTIKALRAELKDAKRVAYILGWFVKVKDGEALPEFIVQAECDFATVYWHKMFGKFLKARELDAQSKQA